MRPFAFAACFAVVLSLSVRAQLIDDFETYADDAAMDLAWSFGDLDSTTPNPVAGTRSLRLWGTSGPDSGFSTTRSAPEPQDLSGERVSFWARRAPGSANPSIVTVAFGDGAVICAVQNETLADESWHRFEHELADLCAELDVSSLVSIHLFAFNDSKVTDDVAVNFDDIEHFLFRDGFQSGDYSAWSDVAS